MTLSVPENRLAEGGWTLTEEGSETRFSLPTMRVVSHTRLYEDTELRDAAEESTGIDRRWRFFFATRLTFEPPLAPGIGPAMVYGTVSSEAKREFAADLEKRGFEAVSRGRGQRMRTETGDRVGLTKYDARYRLDPDDAAGTTQNSPVLPVTGWLGVWVHENAFRLAGGAYPARSLSDCLDLGDERLDAEPIAYRDELLDLIRAVR